MSDQNDVRCIALTLPGVTEHEEQFGFSVLNRGKSKGLVWLWKERLHPKKARVPNPEVIAVRVADLTEKEALLASGGGEKIFTEPHYNGYPAVLVRLPLIEAEELEELIVDAWRTLAPRDLREAWEQSQS